MKFDVIKNKLIYEFRPVSIRATLAVSHRGSNKFMATYEILQKMCSCAGKTDTTRQYFKGTDCSFVISSSSWEY